MQSIKVTSCSSVRESVYKTGQDRINFLNILQHVHKQDDRLCTVYGIIDDHRLLRIETPDSGQKAFNA